MKRSFCVTAALCAAACSNPDVNDGAIVPVPVKQTSAVVSGGTVVMDADGLTAIIADTDGDRLWFMSGFRQDLQNDNLSVQLPLQSHPGRMAIDGSGYVYVALRGNGKLARVRTVDAHVEWIRSVCAEPRGVAWDAPLQAVHVACADGTLATVTEDGTVTTEHWSSDLRDVLVMPDGTLRATTFRTGELVVRGGGSSSALPVVTAPMQNGDVMTQSAGTAWKSTVTPSGMVAISHQRRIDNALEAANEVSPIITVTTTPGTPPTPPTTTCSSYSGCSTSPGGPPGPDTVTDSETPCFVPAVRSALTLIKATGTLSLEVPGALPVDFTISNNESVAWVALAGSSALARVPLLRFPEAEDVGTFGGQCVVLDAIFRLGGIPTGIATRRDDLMVVQISSPHQVLLVTPDGRVQTALPLEGDIDRGAAMFHTAPTTLACASCHPEAGDDGHVWVAQGVSHRSMSLRGGLLATAPFHWGGEHPDIRAVLQDTFVGRMGGTMPSDADVGALELWLDGVPAAAPIAQGGAEQLLEGQALFETAGCATCHSGPMFTNNLTMDVGTGGSFQVPSLRGVGARGPWLHDGRAATLQQRFAPSGGGDKHGATSTLTSAQIDSLVVYLQTL